MGQFGTISGYLRFLLKSALRLACCRAMDSGVYVFLLCLITCPGRVLQLSGLLGTCWRCPLGVGRLGGVRPLDKGEG